MHRDTFRADQRCSKCGKPIGNTEYKNHYCPHRATCKECQKKNERKLSKRHHPSKDKKYPHAPEPSHKQKYHYPKI